MKKKVLLSTILTVALITSLAGCGRKSDSQTVEDSETAVAEETISEDEPETETIVVQDAESEAENLEASDDKESPFLNIVATNVNATGADVAHDRYQIVDLNYTKIDLDYSYVEQYPELAKALADASQTLDSEQEAEFDRLIDKYMEFETSDSEDYITYESSALSKVLRADKRVVSTLNNYYSYEGGAHGYYMVNGTAYDVESGKRLSISDVVKDEKDFTKKIQERLEEKYPDAGFVVDLDSYFEEVSNGEHELNWSIDYSGVTIYFEPYDIASYADGLLTVRFSFLADSDLLIEKYAEVPEDYITPVTTWTDTYADVNGDGKEEAIKLFGMTPEAEWGAYEWTWQIGDNEIKDAIESYDNKSYLVKKNGKFYAYMFNTVENDYQILSIVDIASGNELGGEYGMGNYGFHIRDYAYNDDISWNAINEFINPDQFELDSRMDVFGTYSAVKTYYIGEDGRPVSDDEFFTVDRMGYMITPVKDIPGTLIDKDGNVIEENVTVPKDTMLRIIRTDGENTADLQAWDYEIEPNDYGDDYPYRLTYDPVDLSKGSFYRIEYEVDDYDMLINGESIFNLFEGMMFAG